MYLDVEDNSTYALSKYSMLTMNTIIPSSEVFFLGPLFYLSLCLHYVSMK